jgi:hypothetical protein
MCKRKKHKCWPYQWEILIEDFILPEIITNFWTDITDILGSGNIYYSKLFCSIRIKLINKSNVFIELRINIIVELKKYI